ncbi:MULTISPECIES: hypothetical protein [Bradyrhizobium]|uniref:hypothetical protein n=1 Tax=Bradyrhizobium TaxID=374 RepID=UPI00167E841D|nr:MULTISPECIES: hypothetical protein [Bradyrhizobium]WOH52910.1 hypothetical protein RX328_12960 [Bradyrhizobium sp. sBnM-33]
MAQAFLTALAPAEIDALSCARRAQQQTYKAIRSNAEQQLERRRYESALAERQFNRVDPDNRLVAAELERRWEEALKEVRAAEEVLARLESPQAIAQITVGNKALNDKVVRLSGRLPAIWTDPSTTDAKRKALLRCLIDKVILDRGEHDVVRVRIVWRGGAVTEIEVKMRVNSVASLTQGAEMRERVLKLARTKMHDDEIAAMLTNEGHRSPNCPDKVLPITVQRIRLHAGLKGAYRATYAMAAFTGLAQRPATRRRIEHSSELAVRSDQAKAPFDRSSLFRRAPVLQHVARD